MPLAWKCDGKAHCADASDERGCFKSNCENDEFHCVDQDTCIKSSWRCDGKSDCLNDEDEKLCRKLLCYLYLTKCNIDWLSLYLIPECSLDQFKCQAGGCVSQTQRCDGTDQCPDKSDEWNCIRFETAVVNATDDQNQTESESTTQNKMFLQVS